MNPGVQPAITENILPTQPGEFIIVSGRTGKGKSNLMLHILYSIGTGTPLFGLKVTKETAGLLVMGGDHSSLKDRTEKVRASYSNGADADIGIALNLETRPLEKNWEYYVDIFAGCRIAMLDNLKQASTSERLKPEYAPGWVTNLHRFLQELGAVGIITHHVKKSDQNSLIEPGDVYELKGETSRI